MRGNTGSLEAYVNVHAKTGATLSQQINIPSATKSMKVYLGAGGAGYVTIAAPFNGSQEIDLVLLEARITALRG